MLEMLGIITGVVAVILLLVAVVYLAKREEAKKREDEEHLRRHYRFTYDIHSRDSQGASNFTGRNKKTNGSND